MDKNELRPAFCAASPFDLASSLDDEYRDAVDSILDQFRSIVAVYKPPRIGLWLTKPNIEKSGKTFLKGWTLLLMNLMNASTALRMQMNCANYQRIFGTGDKLPLA